jgi:tetratricopeptide (TPR) repeat protein
MVFGLAVKNLGYSSMIEKLPIEIHAGASYRILENLLVSAEVAVSIFEELYGSIGVEYDFSKTFFLDGGVQIKESPMFAVGLGYRSKEMRINISYTPSIEFYNMISASFSYYFGETKYEERSREIEELYKKAFEYYRDSKYREALDTVEKVLEKDPGHREAVQLRKVILAKLKVEEARKKLEKE